MTRRVVTDRVTVALDPRPGGDRVAFEGEAVDAAGVSVINVAAVVLHRDFAEVAPDAELDQLARAVAADVAFRLRTGADPVSALADAEEGARGTGRYFSALAVVIEDERVRGGGVGRVRLTTGRRDAPDVIEPTTLAVHETPTSALSTALGRMASRRDVRAGELDIPEEGGLFAVGGAPERLDSLRAASLPLESELWDRITTGVTGVIAPAR